MTSENSANANERRLVLVTGASRGIGRSVVLQCAREGWKVICVARAQRALEQLDDEIRAEGKGEAVLVPADLKDYDGLDRLGATLYERYGKLDGLAACAGALGALTPIFQAAPRVIEETIAINYIANQRLIRSMHPLLRASDSGRAVFLTSSVARDARAYWGPYAAGKAALEALVLAYAEETRIMPIKVNLYSPGATATAMRAKAFPGEDPKTLPQPDDVAKPIVDLLRESSERHAELIRFRDLD